MGWFNRLVGKTPDGATVEDRPPAKPRARRHAAAPLRLFTPGYVSRTAPGPPAREMTFAAVDVETTGLDAREDRVCEVAVVRFRGDGTVIDEYATLVDPGRPLGDSSDFHHIADEDAAEAPPFHAVAPDLLRLLSGCVVVAHNLAYEDSFLTAELTRAGVPAPSLVGLCTLVTCRAQLDGPSYKLMSLYRTATGWWAPDAHTALGDSRALTVLLPWLLENAPTPLRYCGPAPQPPDDSTARPGRIAPRAARLSRSADGYLGGLAKSFPATGAWHPVDPDGARAYTTALDEVTSERRVGGAEARRLEQLARRAGLSQPHLIEEHRQAWLRATEQEPLRTPEAIPPRRRRELSGLAHDLGHPRLAVHLTLDSDERNQPATTHLRGWRVGIDGTGPGLDDLAALVIDNGGSIAKRLTSTVRFVVTLDPTAETPILAKARNLDLTVLDLQDARTRIQRELTRADAEAEQRGREQAEREAQRVRHEAEDDARFRHRWRPDEAPPVWGWGETAVTITLPRT